MKCGRVTTEVEELAGLEGPPPLLSVGFDIENDEIVNATVDTVVGKRALGPNEKQARIRAWVNEMQAAAREIEPSARAVLQPDLRDDRFGMFARHVAVIWCDPDVDIDAVRARLDKAGQHVGHVTLHYNPAMA